MSGPVPGVSTPAERALGAALVALQFAVLAAVAIPWRAWASNVSAVLLLAAAGVLGIATLRANPPGNFNVRPEPRASGRLIVGGPYRYIRHPMYGTLLLIAAAAVAVEPRLAKFALWVALAVVLRVKASLEERLARRVWPGYEGYARTTGMFLPRAR